MQFLLDAITLERPTQINIMGSLHLPPLRRDLGFGVVLVQVSGVVGSGEDRLGLWVIDGVCDGSEDTVNSEWSRPSLL